MVMADTYDVLVVGSGNAGLSAALAAAETGARVAVLERADQRERGGNSAFTAGAMRTVHNGPEDLGELLELSSAEIEHTDFGTYTRQQFFDDMARVTESRCDPELTAILVDQSFDSLRWLRSKGVRFVPSFRRQAFTIEGTTRFWGGLALEVSGGGLGLVDALLRACASAEVDVLYGHRAVELMTHDDAVNGLRVRVAGSMHEFWARSVVLACGGFESDARWRAEHLGPAWDLARVRGTRHNTGDGLKMALRIGASPKGHWSGCHAVAWDLNAPEFGDLEVRDGFQKHSYPLGIVVNARGERFLDEGADFRNFTYAKYGAEILRQPGQFAWQIFDAKVHHLLREEYRIRQATKVSADSLESFVAKLDGVDADRCLATILAFNGAVDQRVPFDPSVKDGRTTHGLAVPKSNWANTIDTPPFEAFAVTCGITFTFGGLEITERAEVVRDDGSVIPGLFACGEIVGGLFYFNYPGGTGLTSGTVFGRLAGQHAGLSAAPARSQHGLR
jgi:tricarballylate dehydrogenase